MENAVANSKHRAPPAEEGGRQVALQGGVDGFAAVASCQTASNHRSGSSRSSRASSTKPTGNVCLIPMRRNSGNFHRAGDIHSLPTSCATVGGPPWRSDCLPSPLGQSAGADLIDGNESVMRTDAKTEAQSLF